MYVFRSYAIVNAYYYGEKKRSGPRSFDVIFNNYAIHEEFRRYRESIRGPRVETLRNFRSRTVVRTHVVRKLRLPYNNTVLHYSTAEKRDPFVGGTIRAKYENRIEKVYARGKPKHFIPNGKK